MSILTGFKKVKNYILTSSGYQLLSRWTSSQTVEFDDGKTAQAKLGEINGIAKTYVDMKKATDNSMAVSAKAVMEGLENSSALISMTQAEYDALSDEEKTDNNMRAILDANPDVVDAKNVNFDNTNTNLIATNTQSAITELNGKLGNFYLLYSHLCGTDGNSIWRQNPQFPEEYYAQYTVPEKEGYRFFLSFWQISWTNNNEYSNYLIRNPFLHEKNGNIEVYSKDETPTFVPVFLCIYLPV